MLAVSDQASTTPGTVGYPSSTIWLFLTVELLFGALLSGLLALLASIKSLLPKPPRDLTGDVVLIVGGSSSLGESLAEEFARNRCSVICVDENPESLRETATRLRERCPAAAEAMPTHGKGDSSRRTPTISVYECNLLEKNDIRRTARKVKEDFGRIDVLITCVGHASQDIFDTASTTLMSHFWSVFAFLPMMMHRGRAHIVGVTPVASSSDGYHGSRAAIASLMESLRLQLSDDSGQLTFLAFSPIAECGTVKQSEEQTARNIVRAVKTDRNGSSNGWLSGLFYRISCTTYNAITLLTQWTYSQGCDYPA